MPEYRIGLLGHGTVGSSFARLLEERADAIEAEVGTRPRLSGVLTRSRGDFDEILDGSDLIVELMGGIEPTKDYVLRAMEAGRHVVTANKQLLSQHGEEVFAEAQELGYAEADPTEDVTGKDAAAKMAILARLAFSAAVRLDQVSYEGIERITPDDIAYARELGLSLKLVGSAERVDGAVAVHVYPAFLYAEHPLASVNGAFNAVTIESPAITEITLSGPGAGGIQTASAVLGDVISAMIPPPSLPPPAVEQPIVTDVEFSFYVPLEVADRPGVLAQVAEILGMQGVSIRSVVQKGLGDEARLVMVMHPVLESKFRAAVQMISRLDFVREPPRVIRVIEETF